jgi:hypothetical protein
MRLLLKFISGVVKFLEGEHDRYHAALHWVALLFWRRLFNLQLLAWTSHWRDYLWLLNRRYHTLCSQHEHLDFQCMNAHPNVLPSRRARPNLQVRIHSHLTNSQSLLLMSPTSQSQSLTRGSFLDLRLDLPMPWSARRKSKLARIHGYQCLT